MGIEDAEFEAIKNRALLYLNRPSNRWVTITLLFSVIGLLCTVCLFTGVYLGRNRPEVPSVRQAALVCPASSPLSNIAWQKPHG